MTSNVQHCVVPTENLPGPLSKLSESSWFGSSKTASPPTTDTDRGTVTAAQTQANVGRLTSLLFHLRYERSARIPGTMKHTKPPMIPKIAQASQRPLLLGGRDSFAP